MDNKDVVLAKSNKILDSLKEAYVEQMNLAREIHCMAAANHFWWQGDNGAANHLEKENMSEFYEGVRLLRKKQLPWVRQET